MSKTKAEEEQTMDDPEKLKLAPKANDNISFTPELVPEAWKRAYRYKCPGPGVFRCALTEMVFVMAREAELLYSTVLWDDNITQSAGKKRAGLLFKLTCSVDDAVSQIHLPHCETEDALAVEGLLSVANISDDGVVFLEPLEVTDTHVLVKVPNLSTFGLVRDIRRFMKSKRLGKANVLLFHRTPWPNVEILDVLMLPSNVPLTEVKSVSQHRDTEQLDVPPECVISYEQLYSVHTSPDEHKTQPHNEKFWSDYGPNYHSKFEILLKTIPDKLTVMISDQAKKDIWKSEVHLSGMP
ncbi:uncharacterized protein LOC114563189 [Perca flavescens]|uniref:uncharacterized protein LOC114563189 n=1 Tax=Perca flavescens TaxID=8167 RepID=UPI00106E6ED5|nr:uncharacterized protein LOC114563189 [Perca flavescens]